MSKVTVEIRETVDITVEKKTVSGFEWQAHHNGIVGHGHTRKAAVARVVSLLKSRLNSA